MGSLPTLTTEMAVVLGIIVIAVMILGGGLDRSGVMDRVAAAKMMDGVGEFCVNPLHAVVHAQATTATDAPVAG